MSSSYYDYIPHGTWRFAPLVYAIFAAFGLGFAGFLGWGLHRADLLKNDCKSPEVVPSISATIGDFTQERVLWRMTFPILVLCHVFMLVGWYRIYNKNSSSNLNTANNNNVLDSSSSIKKFLLGRSFNLAKLHNVVYFLRILSALGWTMIASFESLLVHESAFAFFAVFGIMQHVIARVAAHRQLEDLQKRSSSTTLISVLQKASNFKTWCLLAQIVMILGLAKFFLFDHIQHCLPYAYSKACFCEWVFSYLDVAIDATYYYDFLAADMVEEPASAETMLQMLMNVTKTGGTFGSKSHKSYFSVLGAKALEILEFN